MQVLKEVVMVQEYLDYLIEESLGKIAADEDKPTLAEVIAETSAAGEVELFGGGGMDGPAPGDGTPNETAYKPALRTELGDAVLLSGTADATLLAILNNNFFGQDLVANFEFGVIRALVEDVGAAKKKAISREARYSGLLDKLVIEPAAENGGLPTKENLDGVGSWIVEIASGDAAKMLPEIAELAKDTEGLNNVVVMVTGTDSKSVEGWDAVVAASADGSAFKCTLLAVGELYDSTQSGGYYHVGKLADGASTETPSKLSRKKAYQLLAHSLALDSTAGEALVAYEYPAAALEAIATPYGEGEFANRDDDGNELPDELMDVKMESRMMRGVRELGFTMVMELDVLVGKGITALKEYMENPPNKESAFSKAKATAVEDEADKKIMAMLDIQIAENKAKRDAEAAAQKKIEVEGIAKEWTIKEYSLRMLGGDLDDSVTEKDFMVSVWDQALAEGEKTYERINSDDYIKDQKDIEKAKAQSVDKLFWEGMPPLLRKKREKMVENVKKQYMDLLSEEDLERIILSE